MFRVIGLLLVMFGGVFAAVNLYLYPAAQNPDQPKLLRCRIATGLFGAGLAISMLGLRLAAIDLADDRLSDPGLY